MDVNGTKFHSLTGKPDWTSYDTRLNNGVLWDEQEVCIRLRSRLFHPGADQLAYQLTPSHRRGAAGDRYGNIFWIGNDKQGIWFLSWEGGVPLRFWSLDNWFKETFCDEATGDFKPVVHTEFHKPSYLQGLTITRHDYLVAGILEPAGLLVFDLHAGSPPHLLLWPQEISFTPFDMAPASNGGLWILDKGDHPRFWRLDENFTVLDLGTERIELGRDEPGIFQPEDTSVECQKRICFPSGIKIGMSSPVDAIEPVSIESLPDDTIMILGVDADNAHTAVYHYKKARRLGAYCLDDYFLYLADDPESPMRYKLLAQDFVFTPSDDNTARDLDGILYVSPADRKQTFVFDLKVTIEGLSLALQDCYYPMRTTQGKALVAAGGNVFYDFEDKWIPLIAQRAHYWKDGHVTTRVFDGKQYDCGWHRLFLDAMIPDGAGVTIHCLAANDKALLPDDTTSEFGAWIEQPQPYLRTMGSDIPYHDPFPHRSPVQKKAGTWETPLHRVKGRFLTIRLMLTGTGRNTPRIRSLRVYYPRFSYLNEYLPAVYRDDETSADFLERFLANVEGLFTTIEDRIAWAQVLFDVDSVPVEFLDWLAGWFEIIQQESWGEGRRRLWLAHVMELFSQRGTVPGIIRAVRLATDPCPEKSIFTEDVTAYYHPVSTLQDVAFSAFNVRIVENFLYRQAPGVVFGDPTDLEGPAIHTEDKWTPSLGAAVLHKQYQEYLSERYNESIDDLNDHWKSQHKIFADIELSSILPTKEIEAADWCYFLQNELKFTYSPVSRTEENVIAYQSFLARRYRTIDQLNLAWSLAEMDTYKSFKQIPLPPKMPTSGNPLSDWIQFVSIALPTKHNAHQFTVLVPTSLNSDIRWNGPDPEIVRRIVDLEKPAHTRFDVKQYFAMFRVGEARLGMETILESGRPLQDVVLGDSYMAEGFLSLPPAWKVPGRFILGRDTSGAS